MLANEINDHDVNVRTWIGQDHKKFRKKSLKIILKKIFDEKSLYLSITQQNTQKEVRSSP